MVPVVALEPFSVLRSIIFFGGSSRSHSTQDPMFVVSTSFVDEIAADSPMMSNYIAPQFEPPFGGQGRVDLGSKK